MEIAEVGIRTVCYLVDEKTTRKLMYNTNVLCFYKQAKFRNH